MPAEAGQISSECPNGGKRCIYQNLGPTIILHMAGEGAAARGGRRPGGYARRLWRHKLGKFPAGLSLSVSLVGPRLQPESHHPLLGASGPPRAASPRSGSRRERVSCDLDSSVWYVRPPRRCVGFSPGENLGGDNDLPRGGLSVLHRRTKALSVSPGRFNQMSLNM